MKKSKAMKKPAAKKQAKPETVLVLRTCNSDMTGYGGFKWPESGPVEAPDWNPVKSCGQGLHGWLWDEFEEFLKEGMNEGHSSTATKDN